MKIHIEEKKKQFESVGVQIVSNVHILMIDVQNIRLLNSTVPYLP